MREKSDEASNVIGPQKEPGLSKNIGAYTREVILPLVPQVTGWFQNTKTEELGAHSAMVGSYLPVSFYGSHARQHEGPSRLKN